MINWEKESKRYQRRQHASFSSETKKPKTAEPNETVEPATTHTEQEQVEPNAQPQVASTHHYTSRRQRERHKKQQVQKQTSGKGTSEEKPQKKQGSFFSRWKKTDHTTRRTPNTPHLTKKLGFWGTGFSLLLVGSALWLSPLTHVSAYQVVGNQNLSKETILADSGLHPQMTWFWAMTQGAEVNHRLQTAHLNVQNATLERKGRVVTIKVQEYPAVAKVFEKDTLYPVMENQTILPKDSGGNLSSLPLLESFNPTEVKAVAEQLGTLSMDVVKQIKRITNIQTNEHSAGKIALEMRDGNILVSYVNVLGERLAYYPDVKKQLGDKKGLINMEAGIFYAPLTPANNPYASKADKESYEKEHPESSAKTSLSGTADSSSGGSETPDVETQRSTASSTSDNDSEVITSSEEESIAVAVDKESSLLQ
ncbi:MAG: FtsQ-type POTRA domain-containing protein [Aerococcus sp.]|nr:FtsQ-type POTRA domain-containing protein [Aerococcus sp.]